MGIKSSNLTWVSVSDLKKAIKFYTETLGFKELSVTEEYGWAELQGEEGGTVIGLAVKSEDSPVQPGNNGVITLTVDNIQSSIKELAGKDVKMVGDMMEVPGHVRLQLLVDNDGNHLQLVELL